MPCLMTLCVSGCVTAKGSYKNIRYTDADTKVISGALAKDILVHNETCQTDPGCEKRPRTK